MRAFHKHIGWVIAMFGISQAYAQTSAMQASSNAPVSNVTAKQPVLVPQKAVVDSSTEEPKKVSAPPVLNKAEAKPANTAEDSYPAISKMEVITFGQAKPNIAIEQRLTELEKAVFQKSFESQSLFDRTQKLKITILGPGEFESADNQDAVNSEIMSPFLGQMANSVPLEIKPRQFNYFELIAQDAENQKQAEEKDLPAFALQILNNARAQVNLPLLVSDKLASEMAELHSNDLHQRRIVSHLNYKGENPDLRYTNMGGQGTIIESVIALKPEYARDSKYTRALVAHVFKLLLERQDDREGLLSPDATGFGFALKLLPQQKRAIACIEISTGHGAIAPVPMPIKVGDKIEVQGTIEPPYTFAKITLAWEGGANDVPAESSEIDEALPYFPPLDYVGYKHKGEHDYSAAMAALRMGALVGVMAGSMFMPPVALAAPLIMMSPSVSGELKPISDIPLHGGVKVEGNTFLAKIPVSHLNKPGIYYITVWANTSKYGRPIPISRRAYNLTEISNLANASDIESADKAVDKATKKEAKKAAKQEAKAEKRAARNAVQYQQ